MKHVVNEPETAEAVVCETKASISAKWKIFLFNEADAWTNGIDEQLHIIKF